MYIKPLFKFIPVGHKFSSVEMCSVKYRQNADVIIFVWQTVALTIEYTVAVTDGVYDVTVSDNPTMHISVDSNFNRDLLLLPRTLHQISPIHYCYQISIRFNPTADCFSSLMNI
ncbi:transposon protein [Dorcoceras hygrometricum]|uniref:Transposon protein n=1 Tax=Dorcoceras hygrometricum TaxID=472368 RepID=A0A2Z7D4T5_9LAMI|nr:transposon protein [Dorcoceras hygrometricum]